SRASLLFKLLTKSSLSESVTLTFLTIPTIQKHIRLHVYKNLVEHHRSRERFKGFNVVKERCF
ncbi:hypothetical protein KEJ25_04730, partial [Candidatus Bathyarchaeota archaeon]|nr:hypothetical protein [Candidatus Bathyarchaeota archaeon]